MWVLNENMNKSVFHSIFLKNITLLLTQKLDINKHAGKKLNTNKEANIKCKNNYACQKRPQQAFWSNILIQTDQENLY